MSTSEQVDKAPNSAIVRQRKPRVPAEIAAQMNAAADAALDYELIPIRARQMFVYTLLTRAVSRYGSASKAARKLATSRQNIDDTLGRLEAQLGRY